MQTDDRVSGDEIWTPRIERRYRQCCAVVAVLLLIDAVWMSVVGVSIERASIVRVVAGVAFMLLVAFVLRRISSTGRHQSPTRKSRFPDIAAAAMWLALILLFAAAMSVLSYLCITVDAPLIDAQLVQADRMIGFDWQAFYAWVEAHERIHRVLAVAYVSGFVQLILIPAALGVSRRHRDLSEFVWLLMLSAIVLLVVSTPFPAQSAFVHFRLPDAELISSVSDFDLLRAGKLHVFDPIHAQGLVSMPSFHVALAIMYIYAVRHVRGLLLIALPLNIVMILSTPTQGGHYLVDIFGGTLLALAAIAITRRADARARTPAHAATARAASNPVTT